MQIVGFNFTKISGYKSQKSSKMNVNAGIEFTDLEKEKLELLKDSEAMKLTFKHTLDYDNADKKEDKIAQILFEGNLILSLTKDESKDVLKSWKKKTLPENINLPLYNLILKRCAPKALQLQEELNLPSHVRIPRIDSPKSTD
ncbi:hypothetical protein AUJ84_03735 [Candidatus Pacearchaeota archaeon CG1_02_32_132]|nr:MAG: hypothetical protein AUJ84_03735 [Candidatus Pacearchaeota archaeon CG1_02_32_132]